MQADEVSVGQQVVERNQLYAERGGLLRIGMRRIGDDSHGEGSNQPRQLAAAVPEPDDAERVAFDFAAHRQATAGPSDPRA